jgi:hypothetical protein
MLNHNQRTHKKANMKAELVLHEPRVEIIKLPTEEQIKAFERFFSTLPMEVYLERYERELALLQERNDAW